MALQALYGGAFDPVHEGHLAVARAVRDRLAARVALLPTGDPPHRGPARASAAQRLAMLRLALAQEPGLQVDTRELERPGPSYSVDTLREWRAEIGPEAALALVVGADAFAGLPGWHCWQRLFELAHIVVASRPEPPPLPALMQAQLAARRCHDPQALHAAPAGCILRLQLAPLTQSSSAVRARVQAGQSLHGWVPAAVADYIARQGLYRGPAPSGADRAGSGSV